MIGSKRSFVWHLSWFLPVAMIDFLWLFVDGKTFFGVCMVAALSNFIGYVQGTLYEGGDR